MPPKTKKRKPDKDHVEPRKRKARKLYRKQPATETKRRQQESAFPFVIVGKKDMRLCNSYARAVDGLGMDAAKHAIQAMVNEETKEVLLRPFVGDCRDIYLQFHTLLMDTTGQCKGICHLISDFLPRGLPILYVLLGWNKLVENDLKEEGSRPPIKACVSMTASMKALKEDIQRNIHQVEGGKPIHLAVDGPTLDDAIRLELHKLMETPSQDYIERYRQISWKNDQELLEAYSCFKLFEVEL